MLAATLASAVAGCGVASVDVGVTRRPPVCDHYVQVLRQFDVLAQQVIADMDSPRLPATVLRISPAVDRVWAGLPAAREFESFSPLIPLAYGEFLLGREALRRGDVAAMQANMRNFYQSVGLALLEGTAFCSA